MKKVTKENNSEQLYARAISEELAENFDNAFSLYLSAAQAFLLRSKALPNQQVLEKEKCKTSAKTCLERAERIKNARKDALKPPVLNPFSTGNLMRLNVKLNMKIDVRLPGEQKNKSIYWKNHQK